MLNIRYFIKLLILGIVLQFCSGRIHKLEVRNDLRRYIALSSFGFYKGGILDVKLLNFHVNPYRESDIYGFSLDRTSSDAVNSYLESHRSGCLLEGPPQSDTNYDTMFFILDLKRQLLMVYCSKELRSVQIYKNVTEIREKRKAPSSISDSSLFSSKHSGSSPTRKSRDVNSTGRSREPCANPLPLYNTTTNSGTYYSTNFVMYIAQEKEEGLYNLYFHSCPNYKDVNKVAMDFSVEVEEKNSENYLSAGEMPLPALFFMMSLLFFLSGCFWVFILKKSKHPVYTIHHLMAMLVYLKSMSLLFHGINFHFIQTKGEHVAAWAILYYVTHLLKGAVLFITIVLIGTGWTFIKHILSEKDKKIFMVVIPLQVLANVAEIIIEESEEGTVEHNTWRGVFILVDLLCCGAILFPVVWSIRHLQEASHTDGKAAINLRKLKLFRHFYIMIVCYIYFTRIIVYLLKITVPFQYEWLDEMFREMATYVFFVLTGYKFRPASANPYFQVNLDEEEEDMEVVVSQSGLTEGLSKISRTKTVEDEGSDDDKDTITLLAKRESSHEYD